MQKFRSLLLVLFAMVAFAILSFAAGSCTPPIVKLSLGSVEGVELPEGAAFAGIPYAAPPVGDLRWRPPEPAKKWSGVRKGTRFGPVCPQLPQGWLPYIPGQEDCLYLNIWTPHLPASAKLPVIVFFHGGSNTAGYSQFTPLGPPLARLGVVVVTANYRLGPFGFFAHPELTAESRHHSSGNYGLLDQIQVLHWVHENISHFGGDPGRVTIMGQSAGAVDVCMLMASPLATDLFRGAILQSGECQSGLNEDIRQPIHYNGIEDTGEAAGERLASDLGVSNGPDAAQKLRLIPVDVILKAWSHDPRVHFEAIVDGWVVPEQPAKLFAERKQAPVPILIGSNADEATVFGLGVKSLDQYKKYLQEDSGKFADQEFDAYPAASDSEVAARYLQLQNDSFAYAAYSMAVNVARSGQSAYLYYFTFAETGKRASLGAHHGLELNFLADWYPPDWEHSEGDKKLGEYMRGYWAQFAKTGDPNYRGAPAWPVFNPRTDQLIELGRMVHVGTVSPRVHTLAEVMNKVLHDWGD